MTTLISKETISRLLKDVKQCSKQLATLPDNEKVKKVKQVKQRDKNDDEN